MLFALVTAHAIPTTLDQNDPGFERPDVLQIDDRRERGPEAQVVGGSREPRYGATVALTFPQMGSFCTASMITDRVALTAAHCINEEGLTPQLVEQYAFVAWGQNADQPTQTARIRRAIPHPGYGTAYGAFPENDIAVIEIEPVDYTDTVWFAEERPTEDDIANNKFVSVGFGLSEGGQNSSGRKRSAEMLLTTDLENADLGPLSAFPDVDELFSEFLASDSSDNPDNANICSGDSGGPMYMIPADARPIQVAVHSWGTDRTCRGVSFSTSTADFKNFILNQVEEIHGSDDMCENRGANVDAFCDPGCPDDVICQLQAVSGTACQTGPATFGAFALLPFAALLVRRRR